MVSRSTRELHPELSHDPVTGLMGRSASSTSSTAPPAHRACPVCKRSYPDVANGMWPPAMAVPAWFAGDIPCTRCLPAALQAQQDARDEQLLGPNWRAIRAHLDYVKGLYDAQ